MTSSGYKKIMWGILLSSMTIIVNFYEIIPSFLGFYLVCLGLKDICENQGEEIFGKAFKNSLIVFILLAIRFVLGLLIGQKMLIYQGFAIIVLLIEIIVYADILNMSVKILKDTYRIREADQLREKRISTLKAGLVLAAIYVIAMLPMVNEVLDYAKTTITVLFKIWISILIMNMYRYEVTIKLDNEKSMGYNTLNIKQK